MPVLSQENDGCPMTVVLWVKVLLCLLKQFWALRKKEAKCVGIWETKTMGKYLKLGIGEVKKTVGIEAICLRIYIFPAS
jgi:hypothetical protein